MRRLSASTFFIKCVFLRIDGESNEIVDEFEMENGEWRMENEAAGKWRCYCAAMSNVF